MYSPLILVGIFFLFQTTSAEYIPGTPGAAWTQEELLTVKAKLYYMFRYGSVAPKVLRLSFHDCIKYKDGTGGCDGCLNWKDVDVKLPVERGTRWAPNIEEGNNNGLGDIVRDLERVYREADYPPKGPPKLGKSLFESGKSRADLWSYAAIVAVEFGIDTTNKACHNHNDKRIPKKDTCVQEPKTANCLVELAKPIQFQYGRSDCVEHDPKLTYKALKEEKHPSPQTDGRGTVKYFKEEFNFNGRETVAIFGAHTFGEPHEDVSFFPYTWTSSATNMFNNQYYKNMVGYDMWVIDDNTCGLVGNAYGEKPKTRWVAHSKKHTKDGGPSFWIHENLVCPSLLNPKRTHWTEFDKKCVHEAEEGQQCKPDPPLGSNTGSRLQGEDDGDYHTGCEKWRFIFGRDEIALNCEMGLYLDFQVNDGVIEGCDNLELFNASMTSKTREAWSWVMDPVKGRVKEAPICGKQMLAEPAGSTPTYQIFEEYAADQASWLHDFTLAFEKMMRNGYDDKQLTDGPDLHTGLDCDIQTTRGASINGCYIKDPIDTSATYMIASKFKKLANKVYQYNPQTGKFDFGAKTGADNQLWRKTKSGKQFINVLADKALTVEGSSNFDVQDFGSYFLLESTLNGRVVDCWLAKRARSSCRTWDLKNGPSQKFYLVEV